MRAGFRKGNSIEVLGNAAQIHAAHRGQPVIGLIDAQDVELVSRYTWAARWNPGSRSYYLLTALPRDANGTQHTLFLHRLVMSAPKGLEVDHINHDGLDNRKANLRLCDAGENRRNRIKRSGLSAYKGVTQFRGRWRAAIGSGSGRVHLGTFGTEIEAAKAYDDAARERFGDFAHLNFPA